MGRGQLSLGKQEKAQLVTTTSGSQWHEGRRRLIALEHGIIH